MSKPILMLWSVLSFIVSGIFIFQGLMMFQLKGSPAIVIVAALVTLAYGVATIYVLSLSWIKPGQGYVTFMQYLVGVMLVVQVMMHVVIGGLSDIEWSSLAVVALMLGANWLTIKYLAEYKPST